MRMYGTKQKTRQTLVFVRVSCMYLDGIKRIPGGGGEIRTHGRVTPTAVFKTAALNRSATPPITELTESQSYLLEFFLASYCVLYLSIE